MTEQRQLFRISVHRKGFLRRRGETTVCEIYDLTEKGLQIVTETPLVTGETVSLEFQLVDRTVIHCALLVTHADHLHIGGRILQISPEHQAALARFIEEMISAHLVGMGAAPE
jgi:hypothetical protein